MNVLIVFAHNEEKSFNTAMKNLAVKQLRGNGHDVVVSDLYAMKFKAVADGDDLFGLAVNLASRVCDACVPGSVFVTSSVRDLAAGKGHDWDDVGEHSFKGFNEPVHVYRLRWSA